MKSVITRTAIGLKIKKINLNFKNTYRYDSGDKGSGKMLLKRSTGSNCISCDIITAGNIVPRCFIHQTIIAVDAPCYLTDLMHLTGCFLVYMSLNYWYFVWNHDIFICYWYLSVHTFHFCSIVFLEAPVLSSIAEWEHFLTDICSSFSVYLLCYFILCRD